MKYSEANAEMRDLLDQLMSMGGEVYGEEMLVDMAMDYALRDCQVKRSKHEHSKRLMRAFWARLREQR